MHPVFADPKTDVVFKRIFGAEARKPLLIALLNDLLELSGTHRIRSLEHFSLEQRVTAPKSKLSIVDVMRPTSPGARSPGSPVTRVRIPASTAFTWARTSRSCPYLFEASGHNC